MAEDKKAKIIEGEIVDDNPEPKNPKQFVSEKMVGGIAGIIVLIIAGYFAWRPLVAWWEGPGEEPSQQQAPVETATVDENAALRGEVETLRARLAALENRPEPEAQELPDYEDRFAALEETIQSLANQPQPTEGAAEPTPDPRVAELAGELEALKAELAARPVATPTPSATFAQAVAALSPPLYQSRSYQGELEQIRILVLEMPALSQTTLSDPLSVLARFSEGGVPGLASLQAGFERASVEALKTEGLPEDASWWDRVWARVSSVVVVRRTDGGSNFEQGLTAAENALATGDLATAIATVKAYPATEAPAFAGWLEAAENRAAAMAAYQTLVDFIPLTAARADAE